MKIATGLIGLILIGAVGPAGAAPPQVAVCAACHGANGMGNAGAGLPALAGLPAPYLERQLASYKQGTRKNPLMTAQAASLDAAQRQTIAAYYAAMTVPQAPEPSPLPGGAGADLAANGAWNNSPQGVPACNSCHGPYGIGVGDAFPRLAGQPAAYLAAQMQAWQQGNRSGDPLNLMHTVATKLTQAQIEAAAAYYAALAANPSELLKPGATEAGK